MLETTGTDAPAQTSLGVHMSTFKPTVTEQEKAYARSLRLALEPFRQLRSTMPLQYVYTFLLVVENEGESVSDYAQMAEVPQTVMTRHLLDIGDRNRAGEEGFGLVTQERDRKDLRKHHAKVTSVGHALLHRIMTALKTLPAA
jgi:DNA-binding MarR family transcriptional regulator